MSSWIIQAQGLTKTYRSGALHVHALNEVDLWLPQGALAMIYGPSGGGKSTLLQIVGGIDRPERGSLVVVGVPIHHASEKQLTEFRRDHTGFVFQFFNLLPSLDAVDNVCLPLLAKGMAMKSARQQAKAALERVGLSTRLHHRPSQLSGGEQQRVAVARALVVKPALVLADEPTGDLDSTSTMDLIELIVSLNQSLGISFLIATHNPEIRSVATHLFELQDILTDIFDLNVLIENPQFVGEENLNGVQVNHFVFQLNGLGLTSGVEVINNQGEYWLAVDGNYIVRYNLLVEARPNPEEINHLKVFVNLEDINQPKLLSMPMGCEEAKNNPE